MSPLAKEFFSRYVDGDGRVVRHDQGGDTVSEGQAYAMLLAVASDDRATFGKVWRWSSDNLLRSDGLMSWKWSGGRVADPQPAADADVDAAHALALAGAKFGRSDYTEASKKMTRAILAEETIERGGRRFLLAGPWARDRGVVNPSYLALTAFGSFGWNGMVRSSVDVVSALTRDGESLPPDWARVKDDGALEAISGPDASRGPGTYGLDAPRVLIRFAASCDDDANALAARWRPTITESSQPVEIVAAAATDRAHRTALLEQAARVAREHPTYFGWAWAALGRAMLDGDALGGCASR